MRLVNFKLKIPIADKEGEYKEFLFNTPKDICKELGITESALYAICNKTYKWSLKSSKHLEGIIIERETIYCNKKEENLKLKEEKKKKREELKQQKHKEKQKEAEELTKKVVEFKSSLIEKLTK